MSPNLDLPHFKDPHVAATYACAIANNFTALAMEDYSNWTQFKETVMTATVETTHKITLKSTHGSPAKCLRS